MSIFNKLAKPILDTNTKITDTTNNENNESDKIEETIPIIIKKTKKSVKKKENISENNEMNSELFWNYINKLNWTDRSDGVINYALKKNIMISNNVNMNKFKILLDKYVTLLKNKYVSEKHYMHNNKKEIDAFLSHIVAKGLLFYNAILDDTMFADYLIESNEYQNLYDMF